MNDPHVLDPAHAPTPFTADEIRRNSPPGKTIRLLVESEGAEPFLRRNRFLEVDPDGALIERVRVTSDDVPIDPPQSARSSWLDLQRHASFPLDQTTIQSEELDTPLGSLSCLRYTVRRDSSVHTFWFAVDLPGMPVKSETREAERVTSTVTMIANSAAR